MILKNKLGIGWYFNMLYPHTELFGKFISDSIETGLIDAWKERTWAGMRNEYMDSGEEKIVLPDGNIGGEFDIIVYTGCTYSTPPLEWDTSFCPFSM